jgi:hypothetical protein
MVQEAILSVVIPGSWVAAPAVADGAEVAASEVLEAAASEVAERRESFENKERRMKNLRIRY